MTIEQLAAYKMPEKGMLAPAGRQDAIDALAWSGRVAEVIRRWDAHKAPAHDVAETIRTFMETLAQLPKNNGHRAFTEGQRADIQTIAHDAARVAGELREKGEWPDA